MKRISFLLVTLALCVAPAARAQDAATEERLNKLSGRLDDLSERQEALNKAIQALSREVRNLQEQAGKPAGNYASEEDAKRLKAAIEEVDRKRVQDAETVKSQLESIRKAVLSSPPSRTRTTTSTPPPENPVRTSRTGDDTGFEYIIKSGDNLSTIIQAYKDKNIKVSLDGILKANPGLKPEKMHVGQKIFIPAPQ